jgi:hypothetical protein
MTRLRLASSLGLFSCFFGISTAHADVPAEYMGTPYMGAQTIPGRVELANLDEGGQGIAWDCDNNRMNYAPPLSGDSHRPGDLNLPYIGMTNRFLVDGTWNEDFWDDAGGGGRYPSEAEPYEFYMGAVHAGDWVRLTVNVEQAGTYNVSSDWACELNPCGYSIWFNDGSDPNAELDGENKSGPIQFEGTGSYHVWHAFPNQAQVTLTAGMQLMTFKVEVNNHLQYGHLVFDLVGGGTGGAGGAGGAPAGGAGGAPAGGAGGAAAGSGGAPPAAGSGGAPAAGSTGVGAGAAGAPAAAGSTSTGGTAGSPTASTGGTMTTPTGPAANGADSNVDTESGCAHARLGSSVSASWLSLAMLIAGASVARRRQRRA